MIDRPTARTRFRSEDTPSRLRILASSLAAISKDLADGMAVTGAKEKIDASTWMAAWTVSGEVLDIEEELIELQKALFGWKRDLDRLASDLPLRRVASDQASVWSERLLWVAALLEATE